MQNLVMFERSQRPLHALIIGLSGNIVLQRLLQTVMALPFVSPSAFVTAQSHLPEYHDTALDGQNQHKQLVSAVENGEAAMADGIARQHAGIAKENIRVILQNDKTLKQVRDGP